MEDVFASRNNENLFKISSPNKVSSENPTSKQEEPEPPFFLHFPSPFLDDIYTQILTQQHPTSLLADPSDNTTMTSPNKVLNLKMTDEPSSSNHQITRKKRGGTGRKDRHSKIRTAQGLRDRRIRLSLQIAPKFFNLQDILGFDKASKTVEWLLCKSKNAIKELTESLPQMNNTRSSLSECELESTVEIQAANTKGLESEGGNLMGEIKKTKSRKSVHSFPMARESRDKARARARERTRGRMMIKHIQESEQWFGENPNNFDQLGLGFSENPINVEELGFSSPFEATGDGWSYHSQEDSFHEPSTCHLPKHLQPANVENFENYLGTASWSTYWLNSGNKFLGLIGDYNAQNFRINSNNHG